jgi:riboflavin kinase/FMN adenylyltransferase
MRIVRDYQFTRPEERGASVAIGNFDGVHRGHAHVIDLARRPSAPLGVVTFEPHPREFFAPDAPPFRLMNAEARANRLEKLGRRGSGGTAVRCQPRGPERRGFRPRRAGRWPWRQPRRRGRRFLLRQGTGSGTAAMLRDFGRRMGFDVTIAPLLEGILRRRLLDRDPHALSEGDPRAAADMLGHWHRIEGPVLHGEKRGRKLGTRPRTWSFRACTFRNSGSTPSIVDILTGPHAGSYHGVANLGIRPMFERPAPNLETFLFDFTGDLYEQHLSVGLVDFLRPEMKLRRPRSA